MVLIALLGGCSAASPPVAPERPGPVAAESVSVETIDPTEVTAEMAEWVDQRVPQEGSQEIRVRALLSAVTGRRGLDLTYDPAYTGTAAEVFRARKANCLGFTHLLVGLGREIGLPVYYLTFRQRPRFEREGDLVVVWEHVTAGFGPEADRLVLQLGVGPQFDYEDARKISDRTALAMHYSNRGAEMLRIGDLEDALPILETGVRVDPTLAQGWVNLGVVRRRLGDLDGAERAYRKALRWDTDSFQAYQNLAVLLGLRGRRDAAGEMLALLDRRANRDPFAYLLLGDLSMRSGRLKEARRYYRRAVERAPGRSEPLAALGFLALEEGEVKRAKRLLRRAEGRADSDERAARLREALFPGGEEGPQGPEDDS